MMPSRLYKYLPVRYVDDFVRRGRVLFRNLTYFRQYETDESRGDLFEGRHIDRPGGGVKLTNVSTGRTIDGDFAFINSIQTDSVFVFCMSTRLDPDLYEAFGVDACVEITAPAQFVKDCRQALKAVPLYSTRLIHREVEYYKEDEAALGSVKDPSAIPFFKPARYSGQGEYRLMLANPASLELTQRIVQGHALPGTESPDGESPKELWLRLRGARQYMRTHAR